MTLGIVAIICLVLLYLTRKKVFVGWLSSLNPKEPEENLRRKARLASVRVAYIDGLFAIDRLNRKHNLLIAPEEGAAERLAKAEMARHPELLFTHFLNGKMSEADQKRLSGELKEPLSKDAWLMAFVTYQGFFGNPNWQWPMKWLLPNKLLKFLKIGIRNATEARATVKELDAQKAAYSSAIEAWSAEKPICKDSDETLDWLKTDSRGQDPELWHMIVLAELGGGEANEDLLMWIAEQPSCLMPTASSIFCTLFPDNLLQYPTLADCPKARKKRFELFQIIANRWCREDFQPSDVGCLEMKSDEAAYDEAAQKVLEAGAALPWPKPEGIFEMQRGRHPRSAFHYSFEAFSEEGGLRMAPPPKPPLLV